MNTGTRIITTDGRDQRAIGARHGQSQQSRVGETTLLQVMLRQKWGILAFACVATALAAAVVLQMPVRYAATASIIVDPRQPRVISADSLLSTEIADPLLLRTRVEELRSLQIARDVVRQLNLAQNVEYCTKRPTLLERSEQLLGMLHIVSSAPVSDAPPTTGCSTTVKDATDRLVRNVTSTSDGRSFVIWVRAESDSPQLAADIANSYGSTFVALRREEMQGVAQQARVWLTTNASELREKMQSAAVAVETYRADHLLATMRGETLAAMSLSDLNTQLNEAISDLTNKRARLNQLDSMLRGNGNFEASTTVIGMPTGPVLLDRYSQLLVKQAQLRARLGDQHPDVIALTSQLESSRRMLQSEGMKAVTALRGDVAAAEGRRDSLSAQVQKLQKEVNEQGHADVRLGQLEREATLSRELYGTLLTRLTQIQAEESLQVADVRLAVEAQPPDAPFAPRVKMTLVGVFLSAIGLGVFVAFVRDLLTRIFADSDQVEVQTGLPVLGLFPKPVRGALPQSTVVDHPISIEAEAVHGVLASLSDSAYTQTASLGKVVTITSSVPKEGKTSFAVALGRSASRHGLQAVVIDCDLRRPSLLRTAGITKQLGPVAIPGGEPPDLLGDPVVDGRSGLHLLSVNRPAQGRHVTLAALRLPDVIARLRSVYDLIILDAPPVLVAADAISLGRLADEVVMVVTWRKATRDAVSAALKALNRNGVEASGVVLSKVDLRKYARRVSGDAHLIRSYADYHAATRMAS